MSKTTIRWRRNAWFDGLVAACLLAGPASADSVRLGDAYDRGDVAALDQIEQTDADADVRATARILRLGARQERDAAEDATAELLRSDAAAELKCLALVGQSWLYRRAGERLEAVQALRVAQSLSPCVTPERNHIRGWISDIPVMTAQGAPKGDLAVRRAYGGLPIVKVQVNGQSYEALVDTGASDSVITADMAEALKLRTIGLTGRYTSSTRKGLKVKVARLDRVQFGEATFRDAVVFVAAGDNLFGVKSRTPLRMVIGLDLLIHLKRLDFIHDAAGDRLVYGAADEISGFQFATDMRFDRGRLYAGFDTAVTGGRQLNVFVDTGATGTRCSPLYLTVFPQVGGTAQARTYHGLGGRSEETVTVIPKLRLYSGQIKLDLSNVPCRTAKASNYHVLLGQDALSGFRRVVIDFEHMSFQLLP